MRLGRLLAAMAMAVAVGVASVWLEGYNLRLRQKITELHMQREVLTESLARRRLEVSEFAALPRLIDRIEQDGRPVAPPRLPVTDSPRPRLPAEFAR